MSANEQVSILISKYKFASEKARDEIDQFVDLLEEKLDNLQELPPRDYEDQSILEQVKIPLNDKSFKLEATFRFKPPKLYKIGSYQLNCLTKNSDNLFIIDLALEFPRQCWQCKDHRNYIYHRKRAYYLAYIAKFLQSSSKDIVSSTEFAYLNGDHLKPIIVLTPSGKLGSICRFHILAYAEQYKPFLFRKFSPQLCNIQAEQFDMNQSLKFSPIYNSSILKDLTSNYYTELLAEHISTKAHLLDALVLIRLWLEKRGLRKQFSFILTIFSFYLLKKKSINPNLSALQIFESILLGIVNSKWSQEGTIFNSNENGENLKEEDLLDDFRNHFQVVFVDAHCVFNLCHQITTDLYERLKYDSEITLEKFKCLKPNINEIFGHSIDFYSYFDNYINISTDCMNINFLNKESMFLDCGFNAIHILQTKVIKYIQLAAGDRLRLFQTKDFSIKDSWSITSSAPNKSNIQYLTFGLIINREKAFDSITKGPLANQPEAAEFRDLWGNKSEIRRFQNGDICEAVFWDCKSQQEQRKIVIEAIRYILNRKMQIKMKFITSTFGFFDQLLELNNLQFDDTETIVYGTGEHFIQLANQSMVTLKKYLHNLNELSFSIVDVIGIDSLIRSTDVFPPLPINSKPWKIKNFCNRFDLESTECNVKYIAPIEILVKVEVDNKLPYSIEAILNKKYLLHNELGKTIAKAHNLIARATPLFVDLFMNGYVFRISIALDKEVAIRRDLANKAKAVKSVDCSEADEIEFRNQVLPALASCLNTFTKENSSLALASRIFKRWLSIQMVRHFFNDITIDLLVVYAYMYYETNYPTPNSPLKGFIRVLKFFSEFDFASNPVILNFSQTFSFDKLNDIADTFAAERPRLPPIFIVTPYDRKQSYHTKQTPNPLIVYHVKKLAHSFLDYLVSSLPEFKISPIKDCLKPNMSIFDIIIHLDSKQLLNKYQFLDFPSNIKIKQTLYSDEFKHAMPITDFNPALIYLNIVKKAFGNLGLFFYDENGGHKIGMLLRPEKLDMRPFKYSNIEASLLTHTSYSHLIDNVALNINALVEDLQIMGDGLVSQVQLQSNKLLKIK